MNYHAENEKYLKDAIPEIYFSSDASTADVFASSNIKIYATNARIPPNLNYHSSYVDVKFPEGLFSTNPIVIVTPGKRDVPEWDVVISTRAYLAGSGSGVGGNWPRQDGVRVSGRMLPPNDVFKLNIAVHILAIGPGGV